MANNCYNWVSIQGDDDTLDILESRMKDYDKFDNLTDWTNHILGKKVFDRTKDSPYDVVGTRWWDIDWHASDREEGYITIQGDSAWGPPTLLMELLSERFNLEIKIEFEESGSDFGGYCTYDGSGLLEDYTVPYRQWIYEQDSSHYLERFVEEVEYYESLEDVLNEHHFVSKRDLLELTKIYAHENKQKIPS